MVLESGLCGRGETAIVTNTGDVIRLELNEKGFLKLFGIFKISFISLRLSPDRQTEFIETLQSLKGSGRKNMKETTESTE